MRTKLHYLFLTLALFASIHQVIAQLPVITSFSQNGALVCTNLRPASVASVEWASSLSGPWNTDWSGLDAVTVDSNGTIQVSVPMFYRVRGVVSTPAGMAFIPAGSFTMGNLIMNGSSVTNDPIILLADANPTNVYLSAFYVDVNLASYSQWQTVYGYATSHGYNFVNAGSGKAANHPVQTVDWYDCAKWCNARSEQAGLAPVYYTDAGLTAVYRTGEVTAYVKWSANGYRLPTEAEWEKAARGGLIGQRFPWGDMIAESLANYNGNTTNPYDLGPNGYNAAFNDDIVPFTNPVGYFAPNDYGLYDMAGNVFEWCWDWYGTPYAGGSDPRGPASGSYRIMRGGYWYGGPENAYCARRENKNPVIADYYLGFRCVRGI